MRRENLDQTTLHLQGQPTTVGRKREVKCRALDVDEEGASIETPRGIPARLDVDVESPIDQPNLRTASIQPFHGHVRRWAKIDAGLIGKMQARGAARRRSNRVALACSRAFDDIAQGRFGPRRKRAKS